MLQSKNTIAIPPGATIREQLENRGMKQNEFALRMGLSEKHISRLINGQVELTQDVALRLESVLGVPASFWNNLGIPGISYRRTGVKNTSDYSLAAWARKARIEARKYKTALINIGKLEQEIPRIREMTVKGPEVFCSELVDLFSECGIAVVFLPHIGSSFLHGASFYDGKHIVMGLTVRGKDADKFWFSLFHEMCHIIRGHINELGETTMAQENEADAFSRDILISPDQF